MRRMLWLLAGVLLAVVAMGSDSPKEYDDRVKVEELQGTWWQVIEESEGREKLISSERITFRCGSFTYHSEDAEKWRGRYRTDPARKPSHLDWMPTNGNFEGETLKFLYQLDGDTLRIAGTFLDMQRPQGFTNRGVEIWTYKRVKK